MPVSATTIRTVLLRNGFRPAPPTGLGHLASLSAAIASSPVPSTTSAADGVQIIKTPTEAPDANAFAERWVPTMRHYNDERPHRSLALRRRADDADLGRGTGPPGARQGNRARRDHRRPTRRRRGPAPGPDRPGRG